MYQANLSFIPRLNTMDPLVFIIPIMLCLFIICRDFRYLYQVCSRRDGILPHKVGRRALMELPPAGTALSQIPSKLHGPMHTIKERKCVE